MQATILYADLRNFSVMSAAFTRLPDGAELLHGASSLFYSTVVSVARAYEGDVVCIAGDALTVWWPQQIELERARSCGAAMRAALAVLPPIATPDGPFQLDLSIGVATGPITVALVGLPAHGVHLTLYGPAIEAAATTRSHGTAPRKLQVNAHHMRSYAKSSAKHIPPALAFPQRPDISSDVPLTLKHFLPPSFVERLRIGVLLAEYRRCVPAFATFSLPATPTALHNLVAHVQTIVSRWGGWLNEVEIGDKGPVFVILFGAPVAHGNDSSRAVGCCLELRARGLITHAGITLGTLFVGAVGSPSRRVYTVQGDEMNLAARLMEAAAPADILVSGRVRHETTGRYTFSEPALLPVKGHNEPVPVFSVTTGVHRYGQRHLSTHQHYQPDLSPLIGRTQERAILKQAIESVAAGHMRIVIVEGESGIGKSVLLQEMMAAWLSRGFPGYSSECSSTGQEIPGRAWRPILADICNVDQAFSAVAQIEQIEAILADLPMTALSVHGPARPPLATHDGQIMQMLAYLLGLQTPSYTAASENPPGAGPVGRVPDHNGQAQMLELATAICKQRLMQTPTLIMLEDIHWADRFSLQLAARLVAEAHRSSERMLPLLLVLSHRPLDWPATEPYTLMRNHEYSQWLALGTLTIDESRELLHLLLDVQEVSASLSTLVYQHTQGQPLFIKEFVRALHEHRLIQIEQDTANLLCIPQDVQLPDSVQGIIQARVDRLEEAVQLTLKTAAVIGRTFRLSLLHTIHPARPTWQALRLQLNQLVILNIIELEMEAPECIYRFKHTITHEVAYASLLFQQRRALHMAVARWYEMRYRDELRGDRTALAIYETLAYHYGRAKNPTRQVHYCHMVARQALRQYNNAMALEYLATALALTSDARQRYDLLVLRAAVHDRIGERGAHADDVTTLIGLADHLDDPVRRAYAGFCYLHYLLTIGDHGRLRSVIDRVQLSIARAMRCAASAQERRTALLLRAACIDIQGQLSTGMEEHQTAHALHVRALILYQWMVSRHAQRPPGQRHQPDIIPEVILNPRTSMVRCLHNLGHIFATAGNPDRASLCYKRALGITKTTEDWSGEALCLTRLSQTCYVSQHYSEALRNAERAIAISLATGDRAIHAQALHQLALIKAARQSYTEAQRCAIQALTISTSVGTRWLDICIMYDLADIIQAQDNSEEARTIREQADILWSQLTHISVPDTG